MEMNSSSKEQPRLSVAVLGGGYGRSHLRGLVALPELFEVKRVCDQFPKVVKAVLQEFQLPDHVGCLNYKEVLSDPAVDAVVISLPHHLHESVCIAAAQSGKHILVDKPIARTLEEADRIIAEVERHGVTLMIAHNQRFFPWAQKIHEVLEEGTLGQILYATTSHNQNFNKPPGSNWRSKSSVGGGALIGSGVHNLDLMRWFFGEPKEVFAYAVSDANRLEAEVAVSATIRFENGVLVNFGCNWGGHGKSLPDYWGIYGTQGDLLLDKGKGLQLGRDFGKETTEFEFSQDRPTLMWRHFADCIRTQSKPLIDGKDARATLTFALKIYESIETGRPVSCQA